MPQFPSCLKLFAGSSALALMMLLGWGTSARAEKEQFGYEFSISGSYSLVSGGSMSNTMLPGDLINMRNNPWIKLTNTSQDATLDRFVMSIGDEAYNFSSFKVGTQSGTFDIDVNIIDGGNNLELVFANFNPGETVYVKFQIRPDDSNLYQFPDFQHVLFDGNGSSDLDNSLLTVDFTDSVAEQELTLMKQLPDYVVSSNSLSKGCAMCMCVPMNGTLQSFGFSQGETLDPNVPEVPEPSSWLLMFLGASVLCGKQLRRRWG